MQLLAKKVLFVSLVVIFSVMRCYRTNVTDWVSKTVEPTWLMWPWWVKIPTEDFTDEQQFNNSKPHCPALVVHLLHPRHSLCQFTPRGARNKQWYIKTSLSEPGLALEILPLLSVVLVPRSRLVDWSSPPSSLDQRNGIRSGTRWISKVVFLDPLMAMEMEGWDQSHSMRPKWCGTL